MLYLCKMNVVEQIKAIGGAVDTQLPTAEPSGAVECTRCPSAIPADAASSGCTRSDGSPGCVPGVLPGTSHHSPRYSPESSTVTPLVHSSVPDLSDLAIN